MWLALEHKQIAYDLKQMSFSAGDLLRPVTGSRRSSGCSETRVRGEWLAGALSAADITLYPLPVLALRMEKPDLDVRGLIGARMGPGCSASRRCRIVARPGPPHWK